MAAFLLFLTELSTLSYRTIGIGACDSRVAAGVCSTSGADAHARALWLIALLVLVFGFGAAIGRSVPAALAVAVCGLVVLGIALVGDAPGLGDLRGLDANYTQVSAHTGAAFALELVGGVLAVLAGVVAWRAVGGRRSGRAAAG